MIYVQGKKIKARILISLGTLSSASIFLCQQPNNNNFITNNGEWCISSPAIAGGQVCINEKTLKKNQCTMKLLQQFGEKANHALNTTKDSQQRITHLHNIFEAVDRNFLSNVIDQILSNEKLFSQIAKDSYRNADGFLKIVLLSNGDHSWKLRLHIWEDLGVKEGAHNHKWDFYSKVMCGYLSQKIYMEQAESCPTTQVYSIREPISLMPASEDGKTPCPCRNDFLLAQKKGARTEISLGLLSEDIICAGKSYFMPHHLIHAISPGKRSISLVFTSEKRTNNSEIFVPIDKVDTNNFTRHAPGLTKEELREELLNLKKALNRVTPPEIASTRGC